MTVHEQIEQYLNSLIESKRNEIRVLHELLMQLAPNCQLWFLDGKNEEGKIVSNPNIGYGNCNLTYTDGSTKEFYRIGLSANSTGISIYIFGIEDKNYLVNTYSDKLGKAKITGYCIKFKTLKDIDLNVLNEVFCNCFN